MLDKIRVLLADKREIFCKGVAKLIEHEPGIEVLCTCCTALKAIESAYEHQPDVILIDTELFESSGIEAIECIHKRLPKTGIIVLSHSEASSDLLSAVKAGARAYISKDISVESLIKTITLVAEGEVIVSPPMTAKLLAELNLLEQRKDATELGGITLLTMRENEVLNLVAKGLTNRDIAATLAISERTVAVHMRNIMEKLHAHTRQKAVAVTRKIVAV